MLSKRCLHHCHHLLPHAEAGLSSTPRLNDIRAKHLNVSATPVLFLVFLVKQVFYLIAKRLDMSSS